VMFTTRVAELAEDERASFSLAPVILQREVEKSFDVRVTVVGDKCFSTRIHSQDHSEAMVDWRRGENPNVAHDPFDLPEEIARCCVHMTKAMGLGFAAIDFVQDRNNDFWFLELNPNGQWAWIENRTAHPITAAIVDELTKGERA